MLTVCCVFVKANVPYPLEYVTNLRAMVAKHLSRPHDFVCLTDRPWLLPEGIRAIPIAHPKDLAGWWAKIQLFQPGRFQGRVLYLDLDTLIVAPLDPIVDANVPFALIPHAGTFEGRDGLRVVKRFNSSVMVWEAGHCDPLYLQWSPKDAQRLWGDQDFIGEQMPTAGVMPLAWFPRLSELNGQPPQPTAKVVLCKRPKNSIAAGLYPWVDRAWRAA